MLLNEPITRVWELEYINEYHQSWHNCYLHTIGTFEYHVTKGYWLLFETENHYVSIGFDGIQKYFKPYAFPKEKYACHPVGDDEWDDYRDTLFIGQRILSAEQQINKQSIYFDDFKLDLYIYGETDDFDADYGTFGSGINVMAVGNHLVKNCQCGGAGELLIDERHDFAVRCSRCHKSTLIDMSLNERIEAWNNQDTPCVIETGKEKLKRLLTTKKEIKLLALSSEKCSFKMYDETFCDCAEIMIVFEDSYFMLSSQKIDARRFDLTGLEISNYNKDSWNKIIKPLDKLIFIGQEKSSDGNGVLRFNLDGTDLLIEASRHGLSVALDKAASNSSQTATKRKTLF